MNPSAYDLLRSKHRRSDDFSYVPAARSVDMRASGPQAVFSPGCVGIDERVGLWWHTDSNAIHYFPCLGPQWPPLARHELPKDATFSAKCVALLGHSSTHGLRSAGPNAVVLHMDMRLSVFPENGERIDLPRPSEAPLGQVPSMLVVAAPHPAPGAVGVVLVVATKSGKLFSLFLRQDGEHFEAEAGPLWSMNVAEHGFMRLFRRVSRSFSFASDGRGAVSSSIRAVEVLPAPPKGCDALFSALVLSEEVVGLFSHPTNRQAADLIWVSSAAEILSSPAPQLLSAKFAAQPEEGILLLHVGQNTGGRDRSTQFAFLPWPVREEPPQSSNGISVGPAPPIHRHDGTHDLAVAFLVASGHVAVMASHVQQNVYQLSTVYRTKIGLQIADRQQVDAGVIGLALLSEGDGGRVSVLTPHGMLDCPQGQFDTQAAPTGHEDEQLATANDVASLIQIAHELFSVGQEERAKGAVIKVFAAEGAATDILSVIHQRTLSLMDASDTSGPRWRGVSEDVITRHFLHDKARDLHAWLSFLTETNVWTRLGAVPGATPVRQYVAEACERAAAASRLRELDDQDPQIFAPTIRRALFQALEAEGMVNDDALASEAHRFYSSVSSIERLLEGLADYPRSLPLGSGRVIEAMLRVNDIVVSFIDAALERRSQLITSFPALLPAPDASQTHRCLEQAVRPFAGVGSGWLMSNHILRFLEDIRLVNIEVAGKGLIKGQALLDAQVIRVLESFQHLCRATLRAAHATLIDLHGAPMARLRKKVLEQLAEGEASLAHPSLRHRGVANSRPERTLVLAEEFEDFEMVVTLTAAWGDFARFDKHIENSTPFRMYALELFLRSQKLQPLFFRTIKKYPLPDDQLEALLKPHPELRWTMEIQRLCEETSDDDWREVTSSIEKWAVNVTQEEKHSATKRDTFAALALIARAAADTSGGVHDQVVADLSCVGRLQRIWQNYTGNQGHVPSVGAKRPRPEEPPASPMTCLFKICDCARMALQCLRSERCEGQFLSDVAWLACTLEQSLVKQGADVTQLLGTETADSLGGEAANFSEGADEHGHVASQCPPWKVARALQRLWVEVVRADEKSWEELLHAPRGPQREAVLASTGFYRMLAACARSAHLSPPTARQGLLPGCADIELMCANFEEIQKIQPALRLAEEEAKRLETDLVR